MYKITYETMQGCLKRKPTYCYSASLVAETVRKAIEKGGFKQIEVYDLSKELGEIFPIERYYLTMNGWERD